MRNALFFLLLVAISTSSAWSTDRPRKPPEIESGKATISRPVGSPSDLKLQVVRSQFPLNLRIPSDFSDVTSIVYEVFQNLNPGTATFCTLDDAHLARDQLEGTRLETQMEKGCITVTQDESLSFDMKSNRFSNESSIEALIKNPPKGDSIFAGLRVELFSRRDVRGVPTMSYVFAAEVRGIHQIHAFDGRNVWSLAFGGGIQKEYEAAIWEALINGL